MSPSLCSPVGNAWGIRSQIESGVDRSSRRVETLARANCRAPVDAIGVHWMAGMLPTRTPRTTAAARVIVRRFVYLLWRPKGRIVYLTREAGAAYSNCAVRPSNSGPARNISSFARTPGKSTQSWCVLRWLCSTFISVKQKFLKSCKSVLLSRLSVK